VIQRASQQRELVSSLSTLLAAIEGVRAVVLAGSHARGRARPDSDIDLGVFYSERAPFLIESVRKLADAVNDTATPVVTNFYEWGPWVNGGAWLTIGGQRVDLIYRSLEHLERVIDDAEAGRYELHYLQQPPFGFFSGTYLGEIAVGVPLHDPGGQLDALKRRVANYPERLRRSVVQDFLFMAEFTLTAFASKAAARGDTYVTAACLARAVNELVQVLFALNRKYPINDKTALEEVAEFERAPCEFGPRVRKILACLGESSAALLAAVASVGELVRETVKLVDRLYQTRFVLPM
jgi:predicted nucleotidyltransferase